MGFQHGPFDSRNLKDRPRFKSSYLEHMLQRLEWRPRELRSRGVVFRVSRAKGFLKLGLQLKSFSDAEGAGSSPSFVDLVLALPLTHAKARKLTGALNAGYYAVYSRFRHDLNLNFLSLRELQERGLLLYMTPSAKKGFQASEDRESAYLRKTCPCMPDK